MTIPIEEGRYFVSFDKLKEAIESWSIEDHFTFSVVKKDSKRVDYRCRARSMGCPWRVFGSITMDGELQVKRLSGLHTCIAAPPLAGEVANTQNWLRRTVPQHLFVTKATKPMEIVETIRMHYGETVNYEAARLTKAALISDRLEHQREHFHKIPSYLQLLHQHNEGLYTDLHTTTDNNGNHIFQRLFICPSQSRISFQSMRKFMAVDSTFLKARFIQTLLLAVGIDGNGNILLLAWGIVEGENASSWRYFLGHLRRAIPESESMTLISDHDKGLLAADEIMGDGVARAFCCFHLKENFCKRFTRGLEPHFWQIAHSKTSDSYEAAINSLRDLSTAAADYLTIIDKALWVTAFFPGQCYGHKTSNIVESMNKVLKQERELPILDLLNEIWLYTMNQRAERYQTACLKDHQQNWSDFALGQLTISRAWTRRNTVNMANDTSFIVQQINNKQFIVNLQTRTCTCGPYQENGIPCGHALSSIHHLGHLANTYISDSFSILTLKHTYSSNFNPIILADIDSLNLNPQPVPPPCLSPTKLRPKFGRPKLARATRPSYRTRIAQARTEIALQDAAERPPGKQACQNSGQPGHNRRMCQALRLEQIL